MIPSVRTIKNCLTLTREQAEELRGLMEQSFTPKATDKTLDCANELLSGHGIEAIQDNDWDRYYCNIGLLYVNMGDPYIPTLIYDTRREKFIVGCWGDVLEREEQRFAGR